MELLIVGFQRSSVRRSLEVIDTFRTYPRSHLEIFKEFAEMAEKLENECQFEGPRGPDALAKQVCSIWSCMFAAQISQLLAHLPRDQCRSPKIIFGL